MRPSLQAAFSELARERNRVRRALSRFLHSRQCEQLLLDWEHFLDQGGTAGRKAASQPAQDLADRMLDKLGRKVLAYGQVSAEMPDSELHSLRIACKKLRYALEFFRALYPKEETERVIQGLKAVQSALGHLHDASVQEQLVQDCLARLQASPDSSQALAIAGLQALNPCLREERALALERCSGEWVNFVAQFQALALLLAGKFHQIDLSAGRDEKALDCFFGESVGLQTRQLHVESFRKLYARRIRTFFEFRQRCQIGQKNIGDHIQQAALPQQVSGRFDGVPEVAVRAVR